LRAGKQCTCNAVVHDKLMETEWRLGLDVKWRVGSVGRYRSVGLEGVAETTWISRETKRGEKGGKGKVTVTLRAVTQQLLNLHVATSGVRKHAHCGVHDKKHVAQTHEGTASPHGHCARDLTQRQ
jgi:hypothetical protein